MKLTRSATVTQLVIAEATLLLALTLGICIGLRADECPVNAGNLAFCFVALTTLHYFYALIVGSLMAVVVLPLSPPIGYSTMLLIDTYGVFVGLLAVRESVF